MILQIYTGKTKVMRVKNKNQGSVKLHHEEIEEVYKFFYLGSVVSKDGGTDEDIKSLINKARQVFNTLRQIWRSRVLSVRIKIKLFNTNMKSVLLYGSETWRRKNTNNHKLKTFLNQCLRTIFNIR